MVLVLYKPRQRRREGVALCSNDDGAESSKYECGVSNHVRFLTVFDTTVASVKYSVVSLNSQGKKENEQKVQIHATLTRYMQLTKSTRFLCVFNHPVS